MTKYSEIEIETAKNMLKSGFNWLARNKDGKLFVYSVKPIKADTVWYPIGSCDCVCNYVPIFQSIHFGDKEPVSLAAIVNPQILDDAERRYLSAVIRPFRNKVLYIRKGRLGDVNVEYISIQFIKCDFICLPNFKSGTMYKGMEPDRGYTLEELGL